LTGASVNTQASLDAPPRCIEMMRASLPEATRARPPGITA